VGWPHKLSLVLAFSPLFACASHPARTPSAPDAHGLSDDVGTSTVAPKSSDVTPSTEPTEEPEGEPEVSAAEVRSSNALIYAKLDRDACEAELRKRKVAFTRVPEARGVVAPVRLEGPLSGVSFHSPLPASQRKTAPIEIVDCRLVLALDDFARMLARHDIVEVVHLSMWRPASVKALRGGPGRRHGGALAIDAAVFKTSDGRSLSVEKDFHGRIGAKPCPAPVDASELRKIACEAHDARLFNVLLTPDYNWAHRNHFHLEVTAGVPWTLVR
jgi:hypothetical protein